MSNTLIEKTDKNCKRIRVQKRLLLISLFMMSFAGVLYGNSKATATRVYADAADGTQIPTLGISGALETFFGTSGSLNVDAQLSGGQARALQVLSDGTCLVALSKSAVDCVVAKYSSIGTLETSTFGSSGVADLGSSTVVAHAMMLDTQNRCLVAGGDDTTSGSAGWLKRVSTDGNSITSFSTGTDWQFIGALAHQTSGKIIAVGSNNANAQIARYNLDGTLDTTFGAAATGKIIFNGSQISILSSAQGLYNVVVDATDTIYVMYLDGTTAKVAKFDSTGVLVNGFAAYGIQAVFYVNSATPSQIRMAMDVNHNLVIAAQVSSNVKVTAIASSNGLAAIPTFTNYATSGGNTYDLQNLVTTSDHKILLIGSNETAVKNRVTCLTGNGTLDTTFNGSGYDEFSVGSPDTSSVLFGSSISPDGLLYVAGYQINSSVTTSYISCLYNNPYVIQVLQSPVTQEQGNQDFNFGTATLYPGVVTPFYGSYGISLQQKARSIIELLSGNLLVAMDGLTDSQNSPSMMLARFNQAGIIDTTFGTNGYQQVTKVYTNEYITSVIEDASNSLYVSGWSDSSGGHAILRKYNAAGTQQWAVHEDGSSYQALTIALQAPTRILLSTVDGATTGHISGYTFSGSLDTTFGSAGSGRIASTDFGLHMGPLYGVVVDKYGHIFVTYKDSYSGDIKIAGFYSDGSGLINSFGSSGVVSNIFSSLPVQASNLRLTIDVNQNLIVAAVDATGHNLQIARFALLAGGPDTTFNGTGNMSLTSVGSSIILQKITGLSNGSTMITCMDTNGDGVMIAIRLTSAGAIDTTFDSQGLTPGMVSMKVGHKVSSYYARVITDMIVQSATGNLIFSGYEQQRSFDATPIILRIFGEPNTYEIPNYGAIYPIPGTNDTTFGLTGTNGVVILALTGAAVQNQVAQAIALQDEDNFFVALDGQSTANTENRIFINNYDKNGQLNTTFNATGKAEVQHIYQNEYVRDMIIFNTSNVNKAILAGYATSSMLGTGSLLMQYRMTYPYELDNSFGGLHGSPAGVVFADGKEFHTVSRQSMGRIIASGIGQDGNDLILAYTPSGKLDKTFASGGYYTQGINPMYTHVIDSLDNIVIAYNDGSNNVAVARILADGSGLDQNFGSSGLVTSKISGIFGNTNMRIAIDGNGKIIVAAVNNVGVDIVVKRYNMNGSIDVTFTLLSSMLGGNTNVTISQLLIDTDDKIIVVGADAVTQNKIIVARMIASLSALDITFNQDPKTPGYIKYLVGAGATQVATDAMISPSGNIIIVGSKN